MISILSSPFVVPFLADARLHGFPFLLKGNEERMEPAMDADADEGNAPR